MDLMAFTYNRIAHPQNCQDEVVEDYDVLE